MGNRYKDGYVITILFSINSSALIYKAPFLKNQDLKKVDKKSSELAYHGHSQDQENSKTVLLVQKTRRKTILSLKAGLLVLIAFAGFSYMFWYGYDKMNALPFAAKAKKDLMLCQLYLLYEGIPFELHDSDAIGRCNNNIRQLIDLSKSIIRYLDENQMYLGDEYSTVRNYAIIMPLAQICRFEFELFKVVNEEETTKDQKYWDETPTYRNALGNSEHFVESKASMRDAKYSRFMRVNFSRMISDQYYKKNPKNISDFHINNTLSNPIDIEPFAHDLPDVLKASAHGWPVLNTIEKLRMEFSYSYGSIQMIEMISFSQSWNPRPNLLFLYKIAIPMAQEMKQKIDSYINQKK